MAATGNEAVKLSQLKAYDAAKVATKITNPSGGTTGQFLSKTETGTQWASVPEGTVYTGSNGVSVSGSTISGVDADEGVVGVVKFATDSDFNAYMGIS